MLSSGRPLLVSLLLYLDDKWPRQWDAETLFLDDDTDIGIVVRPKRYRAVLMDQVMCSWLRLHECCLYLFRKGIISSIIVVSVLVGS